MKTAPRTPRPLFQNPQLRLLALGFLLLAASACGGRTVYVYDGVRYTRGSGNFHISYQREGTRYRAILEEEKRIPGNPRIYSIRELQPWPQSLDADSLQWLFHHLHPDTSLRTEAGFLIEHPDRAIREGLLAKLRQTPPDLRGAVAGLPRLLRLESRSDVFVAACESASQPEEFDILVNASTHRHGALLAAASDGRSPGGSRSRNLLNCLSTLARQPGLGTHRVDRIAGAAELLSSSSYKAKLLVALVPIASVDAILSSAAQISSSRAKCDVLTTLAKKPGLTSHEAKVLLALLPRASTQALVHASGEIGSSRGRSKILLAIAQKRGLTAAEADAVADATPGIQSSSYEAKVLRALVPQASTGSLVHAARQISSSRQRYEVLASIVRKRNLTAEEADALAKAASALPSSSYRARLILALVPLASTEAILQSVRSVSSSRDKYEVLKALAHKPGLRQAEADRLVAAIPSSLSSTYKARLLIALVGRASHTALSAAVKKISSRSERLRVLEALSKKSKKRRIL